MDKIFVNSTNLTGGHGREHYANVISSIAKDGVCPFCPEHLKKYHDKPIHEKEFWWVTENRYPYSPVRHHRLLIHKKHIAHVTEISPQAWQELLDIIKEESEKRDIAGGILMLRFGQTHFTGASVTHLHAHIVQSDPDSPDYQKDKGIMTRIG